VHWAATRRADDDENKQIDATLNPKNKIAITLIAVFRGM
jgi:hypothetical protein